MALAVVTAATLATLLSGCGGTDELVTDNAKVSRDDGDITIETTDGTVKSSTDAKLPEGFPADVPLIDGTIINAVSITESDQRGWTVMITTDASPADAAAEVKAQLTAAGFTVNGTTDAGQMVQLILESSSYQILAGVSNYGESETSVSYTVVPTT